MKRRAPTIKTIVTAIFVDQSLSSKFKSNVTELRRMILSIMHQVQLVYDNPSLAIRIKIVVIRLEMITASHGVDHADGDIDEYLKNFCLWQSRKCRAEKPNNRWDHALLLTGYVVHRLNSTALSAEAILKSLFISA